MKLRQLTTAEYNEMQSRRDQELENALFTALELSCIVQGGDGDSMIVCVNFVEMADRFEKWLLFKNDAFWERDDQNNYVTFFNNQETIWFSDKETVCAWPTAIFKI